MKRFPRILLLLAMIAALVVIPLSAQAACYSGGGGNSRESSPAASCSSENPYQGDYSDSRGSSCSKDNSCSDGNTYIDNSPCGGKSNTCGGNSYSYSNSSACSPGYTYSSGNNCSQSSACGNTGNTCSGSLDCANTDCQSSSCISTDGGAAAGSGASGPANGGQSSCYSGGYSLDAIFRSLLSYLGGYSVETSAPAGGTSYLEGRSALTAYPVDNRAQTTEKAGCSALAQEVTELVNAERKAAGLAPLTLDASLCGAADIRSGEICGTFSHTRPDGTSCFTALTEAQASYSRAGENIAIGQTTAQQVVEDWMASPGHRANILSGDFTRIGVSALACANSAYNGYAWAQFFAD